MSSLIRALERHGIAMAVVVGLVARAGLTTALFDWNGMPSGGDGVSYVHYARVLLDTGSLESHHFPVGYPLFVAAILGASGGSFAAIRAAQVIVDLLTIVLTSRIAKLLYGARASMIAAWAVALYPPLVFMTGRIMSETLFIALLTGSLLLFLTSDRRGRLWESALAGGVFGLACIVRSNLLAMLGLIPLWQLARPGAAVPAKLAAAALCLAVELAVLSVPGFYFLAAKGEFIPLATNAGQTFYGANNPLADGGWVQVEDHTELLQTIPAGVRNSAPAYSRAQYRLGLRWIREHTGDFLWLLPKKLGNAWGIPGFQKSETTSGSRMASLVFVVSAGLLLAGAIAGRLLVKPLQRDGILLAVLGTYTLMSLAFYGNPRIGLFCAPILLVYASAGLARIGGVNG